MVAERMVTTIFPISPSVLIPSSMNRTATPERRILYQLDHIGSVRGQAGQFLHQDDTFLFHS
jgi:hypothetical protein